MSDDVAVNKATSQGRVANRVLWVVQAIVGVDFIIGGLVKLFGLPAMVDLFDRIGGGQGLRYFIGVVELVGGIGVLIPALAGIAASGLAALLVGAVYTNLFIVNDPPWVPLAWLIVVCVLAWRRWPRTKELIIGLRR
ncbi:DoxX family protein [Verrucosispora sp. WMMA2044]|uniref:DoxX family protein n=1 Tax=Verrucosispora sp. WMMA2044 TaxID=3016419 RepID=UPI00248D1950|nr:DoxX family protein [Verrucosispora sp. WMMA2044]WBB50410.1 DoxX family protein [Verrucosispora sp. WMMA2044]